jgi:hypothetical protein
MISHIIYSIFKNNRLPYFNFVKLAVLRKVVVTSIVCLNSKFPPPVELCWQNKNISKLGNVITKVGNIIIL